MNDKPAKSTEKYRVKGHSTSDDGNNGVFMVPYDKNGITKYTIQCVISDGMGWDHVSVSIPRRKRCPNWDEMCYIKGLFFKPEECVVQFHPPEQEYVNNHPYVLHMWRSQDREIPMPPTICV